MAIQPNLPNPSFADASAYDSDDDIATNPSATSSSSTGVVLGFDDGEIPASADPHVQDGDTTNMTVSRIGGVPLFPLTQQDLPPSDKFKCPLCSTSMPLFTQVYAPLSDEKIRSLASPYPRNAYRDEYDRLLYVLGCIEKGCNGVRLLRAGRRSQACAKAGQKKRKLMHEEQSKQQEKKDKERQMNPFASTSSNDNPFATANSFAASSGDFGSAIFGEETLREVSTQQDTPTDSGDTEKEEIDNSAAEKPTFWDWDTKSSYTFPPRYLSTSSEHLSSPYANTSKQAQLAKKLASMSVSSSDGQDKHEAHKGGRISKSGASKTNAKASSSSGAGDGEGWSAEAYEVMRLSGVEEVFLAFQERLEASEAAEQIVRYEFQGTPLPFQAKSRPYQLLYRETAPPGSTFAATRAAHSTGPVAGVRQYDLSCSAIPKCPHCQSPRTFEMQLMPNLVNILEKALGGKDGQEIGWATVWCFTCSADCFGATSNLQLDASLDWQGWREEVAMIELES